MIKNLILKSFKKHIDRGWDTMYFAVDLHETCIKPTYNVSNLATEFYPLAEETLRRLSNRPKCVLILSSCLHAEDKNAYLDFFESMGIHFKYVNSNPEISNTQYADFSSKYFADCYIEDKAGFDPERHWQEINEALDVIDGN